MINVYGWTPASHRPDFVYISMEARKKQMIGQISNNIISQIDPNNNHEAANNSVPAKNSILNFIFLNSDVKGKVFSLK